MKQANNEDLLNCGIYKKIITIIKMIIAMAIVFFTPFVLPIILKLLINNKVFQNIEEFNTIANSFYNFFPVIYIIITIIILLWFFYKGNAIKEFLESHDVLFNFGDKSISAKKHVEEEIKESNKKIKIIDDIKTDSKADDSKIAIEEAQKLLFSNNKKDNNCIKCDVSQLEKENRNLRYYAAYNIINAETKKILNKIYNTRYISANEFKNRIIHEYININKKTIKLSKKDIYKIANSKCKTIYEGLKFLNIIEPSEDDKKIKLTMEGKKFVEEYIYGNEVV